MRGAGSGRTPSASHWSGPAESAPQGPAAPPGRPAVPRNPATARSRVRGTSPNRTRYLREGVANPRGDAVGVGLGVFGVARLQWHAQAAGGGAQLLQRHAARAKLVAIGRVDVAVPELRRQVRDVRQGRRRYRYPGALRRVAARPPGGTESATAPPGLISKPIFNASRSNAEATGSTTSASSAVGVMKRSAWA